jgi:hypothetical protein
MLESSRETSLAAISCAVRRQHSGAGSARCSTTRAYSQYRSLYATDALRMVVIDQWSRWCCSEFTALPVDGGLTDCGGG